MKNTADFDSEDELDDKLSYTEYLNGCSFESLE